MLKFSALNCHSRLFCLLKMASAADLSRVKAKAEKADKLLANLQRQIQAIRAAAVKAAGLGEEAQLLKENEALKTEIQSIKTALVLAEIGNGVRQVQLPSKAALSSISTTNSETSEVSAATEKNKTDSNSKKSINEGKQGDGGKKKAKTEMKNKDGKGNKDGESRVKKTEAAATPDESVVDISRLDMRVGKIVQVEKHPDADSLYVEQVDLGEGRNRTIVSGLVKHVPINAMKERIAVFMCNLKPAKMRGVLSEGMIMCAVGTEKTEILVPPTDSVVGDRVVVKEYPGSPDTQLNPKKKIWETLKPDVRTNQERIATYKGAHFVIQGKGTVEAPTLADAQIS